MPLGRVWRVDFAANAKPALPPSCVLPRIIINSVTKRSSGFSSRSESYKNQRKGPVLLLVALMSVGFRPVDLANSSSNDRPNAGQRVARRSARTFVGPRLGEKFANCRFRRGQANGVERSTAEKRRVVHERSKRRLCRRQRWRGPRGTGLDPRFERGAHCHHLADRNRQDTVVKILGVIDAQCRVNRGKEMGALTRSLTIFFESSSVTPYAPVCLSPPPARTQVNAEP